MKKDKRKKNLDVLLERLMQDAVEWEAERDNPDEKHPVDKEFHDQQEVSVDEDKDR